jgi:succinyl-CoA synthetase beta subunit
MILQGKIFDIVIVNDKVAQIVIRKKLGEKIVPVAVSVFGYWKDKALNELKLKPKDKIKGNLYIKSKIFNGRYYTDIFYKDIILVEEHNASVLTQSKMFDIDTEEIDQETGEIIPKKI